MRVHSFAPPVRHYTEPLDTLLAPLLASLVGKVKLRRSSCCDLLAWTRKSSLQRFFQV